MKLEGIIEVIKLVASAAPSIVTAAVDINRHFKENKSIAKGDPGGQENNVVEERLSHIERDSTEVSKMIGDLSQTSQQDQGQINALRIKLDQMSLEARQLRGMVGGLSEATQQGHEKINEMGNKLNQMSLEAIALRRMVRDLSQTTQQAMKKITEVDKKLDQMSLEANELRGMVESLTHTTLSGFERMDNAFSQVTVLIFCLHFLLGEWGGFRAL